MRWRSRARRGLSEKIGEARGGWTLAREATPVPAGYELLLPDFTLRHADGREALVEIVGFWTPEYLETKLRKVAAAGLDHLILVLYRGLAAGAGAAGAAASAGAVIWFKDRPRIAPVMEVAERVGRRVG